MTQNVLELRDIRFRWPGQREGSLSLPVLDMRPSERVLILGESGSGKSTLLSLICGTIVPQSGQIAIAGTQITKLTGGARDRFRAENLGVIFQQFNLLPFASVCDNILLPLRFAPDRNRRVAAPKAEAGALCKALGLREDILGQKARRLSVGQQQRVAVARALIGEPGLIIADEPTSALDATNQAAFLDVLFAQITRTEAALLMVSHDPRLADRFDRVLQMEEIAELAGQAAA